MGEGETVEEFDDSWLDDIALFIQMSEDPLFVSKEKKANPLQVIPSYLIKDSEKDSTMQRIKDYLTSHHLPEGMSAMARRRLQNQSKKFLIKAGELYKRNGFNPPVKAIFLLSRRLEILKDAHERLGHRGEYAVMQTLKQRFYWPTMWRDAQHHVKSCHECQIRSTKKVEVPLTISVPSTLFTKIYVDIMYMDKAGGFQRL